VNPQDPEGSYSVELGNRKAPVIASISHRLVQPWRRTGGMYAPSPPRAEFRVHPSSGDEMPKIHKNVIGPLYSSHYDLLKFFGEIKDANGVMKSYSGYASLLDGDGNNPGDGWLIPDMPSNLIPSPTWGGSGSDGSGSGDGQDPEPDSESESDPNPLVGGPDGSCGCGPPPTPGTVCPACPKTTNKCKGTCGLACPANGHCQGKPGFDFTANLPCPPFPTGCGKSAAKCKCPQHPWSKFEVEKQL